MKKMRLLIPVLLLSLTAFLNGSVQMSITRESTVDSLGACQGISYQKGRVFLYGDREVGMIREYKMEKDSLLYLHKEYKLTQNGQDVIGHPTGIAWHGTGLVFMGNSVRLNAEGTRWKAMIYCLDWNGLLKTGTLDGNLLNTIEDDACIQGIRPEYVQYQNKWYVATADYGNNGNEVRLYDPQKLRTCKRTSEPGVMFKKFRCSPWVQNLHWVADKGMLMLIQNQIEGRKWRFTYVDLAKSIENGTMVSVKEINEDSRPDELEGFAFLGKMNKGIAVTSSHKKNTNYISVNW
ncbi:hypothetical protein KHS38_20835 [Mucilaginibacter sp. Bleaf8]|uniref:hypothetical protein n=1 Tax=Mucilaginibacter sp. Bleaf8 TaxID=2834430 RepID=UPI001BCADB58|nr:hypothetical protein [Mucilaginibacter sp. Bleaf8]MBS7566864.1 hypothetical protein [Mucilaginibacter sp. Bleaf8]